MVGAVETYTRKAQETLTQLPLSVWRNLIILLCVIWLAHSLSQLFWVLMPTENNNTASANTLPANVALAQTAPTRAARAVDIDSLRKLHIFGEASEEAAVVEPEPSVLPGIEENAAETKLNLQLKGVLNSTEATSSRAIIGDSRKSELYAPGDDIQGSRGVKLAKVMDHRVILDNNGNYESLWLYEGGMAAASKTEPVRQERKPPPRRTPPKSISDSLKDVKINDVVKVSIVRESGKVVGFKVRPGRHPDLFNRTGLQAGDVITAVNGTELDSAKTAMNLYNSMRDVKQASLDIRRGHELLNLDIDISDRSDDD